MGRFDKPFQNKSSFSKAGRRDIMKLGEVHSSDGEIHSLDCYMQVECIDRRIMNNTIIKREPKIKEG